MSLRSKIVLILAIVVSVFSVADNLIQRGMVGTSFRELEGREATKDLQRVVRSLEGEQGALERRASDWAATDMTREICLNPESPSVATAFEELDLADRDLHLIYVCAPSGKVLSGRTEDGLTGEPIVLREMPQGALSLQHPLLKLRSEDKDSNSGLLMTDHGMLLVGSHVIIDPATKDFAGTLILGRFLNSELQTSLSNREQVSFSVWPVSKAVMPEDKPGLLDKITTAPEPVQNRLSDGTLQIYTTIRDLLSAPTILLRADIDPEITRRGERSVNYALLSTIGSGLLIMFVLVRLLTRIVIGPLTRLTNGAIQIGQNDDTALRIGIERNDEIGQLSAEFDSMLDKLEVSRQDVIRTSRMAGMSEIATGVLHNVGNVLNSVNVSANLVSRKIEMLPVADLVAMRDVLKEHQENLGDFVENDEQGKHLMPFLDEVTSALDAGKSGILSELSGMNRGVEHIGELVRSQQSVAGRQGVREPTDIAEHIESALVICQQAGKGEGVSVTRSYPECVKLEVDRHKLMEIVVNLIKNAFDAMKAPEIRKKRLKLGFAYKDGQLQVRVKDSGCGIEEDNRALIFSHGFTTNDDGHGFGLHVSANAATEMKGSLGVESEGVGKGATFVLKLPAKEARVAQAA